MHAGHRCKSIRLQMEAMNEFSHLNSKIYDNSQYNFSSRNKSQTTSLAEFISDNEAHNHLNGTEEQVIHEFSGISSQMDKN